MVSEDFYVKQNCPGAVWASGFAVKVPESFIVIRNLSRYSARPIQTAWSIFTNGQAIWGGCVTWRSTGQSPGTLAIKLSRCKEGMARVFAVQVQSWLIFTRVAIQSWMRVINLSPVTNFIRCCGAVRIYLDALSCLGSRSKSKNRDEPINFIVRVSTSAVFKYLAESLYMARSIFFVYKQNFDLWVRLITISITRRIWHLKKNIISDVSTSAYKYRKLQKNWPATKSVEGSENLLSNRTVIGARSARAFSIWIKLSLRINNRTIKLRWEAN